MTADGQTLLADLPTGFWETRFGSGPQEEAPSFHWKRQRATETIRLTPVTHQEVKLRLGEGRDLAC